MLKLSLIHIEHRLKETAEELSMKTHLNSLTFFIVILTIIVVKMTIIVYIGKEEAWNGEKSFKGVKSKRWT